MDDFDDPLPGLDGDEVELAGAPAFTLGERVVARYNVRNDGTYAGRDIGDRLVTRGDVGYVRSIGTFVQRYYVFAVEFVASGTCVGMRARELVSLDNLPPHVVAALGDRVDQVRAITA
ncbi:MAG: nitrogen fixation protein NifZ [Rhodocyclaceae bacterium]